MLFHFKRINKEFNRVRKNAVNLRIKFETYSKAEELLADCHNLTSISNNLLSLLPEEISDKTSLKRHLFWMEKWLKEDKINKCKSDIKDICETDLDELEILFMEWLEKGEYYDKELVRSVGKLVDKLEFDSAIRKSFIILTNRLRKKFHLKKNEDGSTLVNQIFGTNGVLKNSVCPKELQSMRDLLSGLYGVFRNKYAHGVLKTSWIEADAIISIINIVLKMLGKYRRPIKITKK